MTGYLLDTNVVSALAPARRSRPPLHPPLRKWLLEDSDDLYLSAITMLELEAGVLQLGRMSPGRFQQQIAMWFSGIGTHFADRMLSVDLSVAARAAAITDQNAAAGLHPGTPEIIIAATAFHHQLTLLTRNLRHFATGGVIAVDPFAHLSD